MTSGEARGIGCLVAFVLGALGATGLWLAVRNDAPRERRERGVGAETYGEPGYAPEPPVEPVRGAIVLAKTSGMSAEIALDATNVYFASSPPGDTNKYRLDILAVPRSGGAVRTLAQAQSSPSRLTPGADGLTYLTTDGVMKIPWAGGAPVKLAAASYPKQLVADERGLTWVDDRTRIVELGADGTPHAMGSLPGEVVGFAVDRTDYYAAVRNPSGYRTAPGEPAPGEYGIVRVPREEGAKARILAQLPAVTDLALDAEQVWWVAPTTQEWRWNYCVFRLSTGGGTPRRGYCDEKAGLSQLRWDGREVWLASVAHGAGTYEELTVRAVGPGASAEPKLRWAGSYPGSFGYAITDDAIAFVAKGEVSIVRRE